MIGKQLTLLAILLTSAATAANNRMVIGDGQIDGFTLKPYRLTWQQCSFQDGQWVALGALTEELTLDDDKGLQLRQTVRQPQGVMRQSDAFFDRSSFAPRRLEVEGTRNGIRFAYSERLLSTDGYTGVMVQGEDTKELAGKINSTMLHGGAMGLPLATMAWQDQPVEFLASMIGFDGTYDVVAEWVGKETLEFAERKIESWLVDVEWHHVESGDVYPAGPHGSGGRYWVVPNPPDGFPYVPRYQTDTYSIEFDGGGVCPES